MNNLVDLIVSNLNIILVLIVIIVVIIYCFIYWNNKEDAEVLLKKTESVSKFTSAIIIPIVLLVIGQSFSSIINEKDRSLKYIELSTKILTDVNTKEQKGIRTWAVKVLNRYSEEKFSLETTNEIIKEGLPSITKNQLYGKKCESDYITEEGIQLANKGDLDGAINKYKEAEVAYPDNCYALNHEGFALYLKQRFEEAKDAFSESLVISPNYSWAHYNIVLPLWYLGQEDEAIEHLKRAITFRSNFKKEILKDKHFDEIRKDLRIQEILK